MKKLVIANWKMNPQTLEEAFKLFRALESDAVSLSQVQVVICPPFVFLPKLARLTNQIKLGAQNMSMAEDGAHTGEVSAKELKSFGVEYVILGHSERRIYEHETDKQVNEKIKMALKHHIIPIVCLGGGNEIDKENMKPFVTEQFHAATKDLDKKQLAKIVFAYEPVWAISTMQKSQPATGEQAINLILHIKNLGAKKVLYGGTVNKDNVHQYAKYPEIDGALVGAASLEPENFGEVIKEFAREVIHK